MTFSLVLILGSGSLPASFSVCRVLLHITEGNSLFGLVVLGCFLRKFIICNCMGCLSTLLLPHLPQGFLNQFNDKMIPPLPQVPLWGCGQVAENLFGVWGLWMLNTRHQNRVGALDHAAPCWKRLKLSGIPENPSPRGLPLSQQELQVLCPLLQQCQGSPHFSLEVTACPVTAC